MLQSFLWDAYTAVYHAEFQWQVPLLPVFDWFKCGFRLGLLFDALPNVIIEVFESLTFTFGFIHLQEVLDVILIVEALPVYQLMVFNINLYRDASAFVGKLQSVGQKVKKHLQIPPLIPHYGLDQVKVDSFVYDGLQLNFILRGHKLEHMQRFKYSLLEVKVLIC